MEIEYPTCLSLVALAAHKHKAAKHGETLPDHQRPDPSVLTDPTYINTGSNSDDDSDHPEAVPAVLKEAPITKKEGIVGARTYFPVHIAMQLLLYMGILYPEILYNRVYFTFRGVEK